MIPRVGHTLHMKKLFIVANWKSNKTIKETEEWLHDFSDGFNKANIKLENKKIIIAPPFTSLEHARYCSGNLKLSLEFAAQDVSPFSDGAYTGEVSARQIKELVDYTIVGHSERRKYFGEDDNMVIQKIIMSRKYSLVPIVCVSDLKEIKNDPFDKTQGHLFEPEPQSRRPERSRTDAKLKMIVAYEPLFAIGSGKPDTPVNADKMAQDIKRELGIIPVLYGGSVSGDNVYSFTSMPNIDGVLVGGASLDPYKFTKIVKNA